MPTGRAVVAKTARPLLFSVPVPSVELPFRKVMVPVGVPVAEITEAVKVTSPPNEVLVGDALSMVAVVSGPMFTTRLAEVDAAKLPSLLA